MIEQRFHRSTKPTMNHDDIYWVIASTVCTFPSTYAAPRNIIDLQTFIFENAVFKHGEIRATYNIDKLIGQWTDSF